LRELHHENVAAVYGMFTSSKFHYLVTEFGSRRSLHELLERNEFELNVTFKLSLIYDLVRVSICFINCFKNWCRLLFVVSLSTSSFMASKTKFATYSFELNTVALFVDACQCPQA